MRHPERLSSLILRPSVVLCLAWATFAVARLLLAFTVATAPAAGEPWRLLSPGAFAVGSGVQVLLALGLVVDLRLARRAPIGLRRTQTLSGLAALGLLVHLQVLGTLGWLGLGA